MKSHGSNGNSLHVAIIMDGNGRWAHARGLPRTAGHQQGAETVRRIVEIAPQMRISTLTLYAFSSDNWSRPRAEVAMVLRLVEGFLRDELAGWRRRGVRLSVIGRRDRLPGTLLSTVERSEKRTAEGRGLHLRLAVDYSARQAIVQAARLASSPGLTPGRFTRLLNQAVNSVPPAPDVDLLIRTSGEKRLSDFLLWESAYAELCFIERCWPDFTEKDLAHAIDDFRGRQRRFGRLAEAL